MKLATSISTTTATCEANHADDKAQAGAVTVRRSLHSSLTCLRCTPIAFANAPTALILARVFGNNPEFWLNVQRRSDLWEATNSPRERERIKRARPIRAAA